MKLPDAPAMRVILAGDRNWSDWAAIVKVLRPFDPRTTLVITGGAPGADTLAEMAAKAMGFEARVVFPADWKKYGRAAGPRRNQQMLEALLGGSASDHRLVIGFHDSLADSKGTRDMLTRASKAMKRYPDKNLRVRNVKHG